MICFELVTPEGIDDCFVTVVRKVSNKLRPQTIKGMEKISRWCYKKVRNRWGDPRRIIGGWQNVRRSVRAS